MKKLVWPIIFLTIFAAVGFAQPPTTLDPETIENDKRGFEELGPIMIDIDGDGKNDRIQPRTYRTFHRPRGQKLLKRHIKNWITFDLATTGGKRYKSIFTYNYGTAEQGGSYWVWSLTEIDDVNDDGRPDLMFYTGDDTSDETIILINKRNRFPIFSREKRDSDDWIEELLEKPKTKPSK